MSFDLVPFETLDRDQQHRWNKVLEAGENPNEHLSYVLDNEVDAVFGGEPPEPFIDEV